MGFTDALQQATQKRGPECSVAVLLNTVDKSEAAAIRAALADKTIGPTVIVRALGAIGHKFTRSTIARHRNRECSCD